jgi:hypothetical protein
LRPLIPKGFFYDRFPTESNSAAEIHAREVESSKKVLEDEIIALETQAALVIKKHNNFFVPHFGLKAQQGIAKLYLRDESSNWKGVTGGAQANSIANEIMTYKSPAPSETKLTQVECVGLIINMIKRYELSVQVSQSAATMTTEDVRVFLGFDKRPTYSQYTTTTKLIQTSGSKLSNVTISLLLDPDKGWLSVLPGLKPANTDKSTYKGTWAYKSVRNHPSGFKAHLIEIARFYERAFKTGKPQSYWQLFSQYRLGIFTSPELNGRKGVALYRVDPFTGAPNKTISEEDIIATGAGADADGTLLSQVRAALFPEMYTLEAGVNYNVGDAKVRYANELKVALTLWDGVMDKPKTPLVTVATQNGGMSKLAIYIQPTGIEAAMSRLVKGRDFQRWFEEMLGTQSYLANNLPNKTLTSQITDAEWRSYKLRMNRAIDTLHNALTHPATPMLGIYDMVERLGLYPATQGPYGTIPATNQPATDAKKILELVGWPTSQPSKLFEVYVNDKRDANVVMNTVFNYLNEESLMAPPEMYFAESIQAKLESAPYIAPKNRGQQGGQSPQAGKIYSYEIVQKVSRVLDLKDHKKVASIPGVSPAGAEGSHRRYFNSGKTIVSKASVGSSSTFLPEGTELIAVPDTLSTYNLSKESFGRLQPEERNLLLGGIAVMSILGIVYMGRR